MLLLGSDSWVGTEYVQADCLKRKEKENKLLLFCVLILLVLNTGLLRKSSIFCNNWLNLQPCITHQALLDGNQR